jgi:hypothetical protein
MTGLDLSTKAGVLRFCELRRAEMVGCFERLGRFESNRFAFCGYVFATHAVKVPPDPGDLDGWTTGAKLGRITAERVRMPSVLHGLIPPEKETLLFSMATRQFAKLSRSVGSLVMSEMWHVQTTSIGERQAMPERLADYTGPGRREVLQVQVEHVATGRRVWQAEIRRDPTRLDPWRELELTSTDSHGRLVDMAEWRS